MVKNNKEIRHDWTNDELLFIYKRPLLDLIYTAAAVHRLWHRSDEIQLSTLLSVKTGGCPEDCSYCGQAARYHTDTPVHGLLPIQTVLAHAKRAQEKGATRFCMAAAWREVRDNRDFDKVLDMVKAVNGLGLQVCCTLGMLTAQQAKRLQEAGLYAYNHNLDSSASYYKEIISTRTFDDRLETIAHVRRAGITVCSGGIIGLGESTADRIAMLCTLATMEQHPESVPINALSRVAGTPLADQPKVDTWDMVRMVATARIAMPASMVRLSAGRMEMSEQEQAWCFMAGANSIFTGDDAKLLVTPNPSMDDDLSMLAKLGLKPMLPRTTARTEKEDEYTCFQG
ncbi:biotin synthase BioB [Sphingobacterium bambusae]|uniref:Biotin synthase n=1 Tax=Sphingobacterium bambusae TaxID=662858 RepID=A0ABW6BN76_9SPHI|nr:biotin synthase BioB [Sphingobacterium bambusae]WPL47803.1 biotin synthase BioB [Sphingobacterium bambusae]